MEAARWATSCPGRPAAVSRRTDRARHHLGEGTEGGSSGLAFHHGSPCAVLPAVPHRPPPPVVPRRPASPPADPRCGSPLLSSYCRYSPVPQPAGLSLIPPPALTAADFLAC